MRYDLLITEINNDNSRKVLAHQLARDPGVSFQDALQKLQKLPVALFRDLNEQAMAKLAGQYLKYGVKLKAAPAHQPPQVDAPVNESVVIQPKKEQVEKPDQTGDATKNFKAKVQSDALTKKAVTVKGVPGNNSIDQVRSSEKKNKNNEQVILFSFLVIFLSILMLMIYLSSGNNKKRLVSTTVGIRESYNIPRKFEHSNSTSNSGAQPSQASKRKSVTVADKKKSVAMCDSARNAGNDKGKLINFYKIAISFNKYNLDAWFGLIAAYKSAGMSYEYLQASNQMKEIFGDNVFEISSQVSRFGDVGDMYISEKGVLTMNVDIEAGSKSVLEKKAYSLIKILHSNYDYESISVVVGNKKRDRMVVHIRPGMEIATFVDFRKNASVVFFDK